MTPTDKANSLIAANPYTTYAYVAQNANVERERAERYARTLILEAIGAPQAEAKAAPAGESAELSAEIRRLARVARNIASGVSNMPMGATMAQLDAAVHALAALAAHPAPQGTIPRFAATSCSQCGQQFGPGNQGFSHCQDHAPALTKQQADKLAEEAMDRVQALCEEWTHGDASAIADRTEAVEEAVFNLAMLAAAPEASLPSPASVLGVPASPSGSTLQPPAAASASIPDARVTLTGQQLKNALYWAIPDDDEVHLEAPVTIAWSEGIQSDDEEQAREPGYVLWWPDYPDEGCVPLDDHPPGSRARDQAEGQDAQRLGAKPAEPGPEGARPEGQGEASPQPVAQEGEVEPAPPNSLPEWDECALRVHNSNFIAKRVAEGGYGPEPDSKLATQLHRFIYEYDDADPYRSAWFLHRLELLLAEVRATPSSPQAETVPLAKVQDLINVAYERGRADAAPRAVERLTETELAELFMLVDRAAPALGKQHARLCALLEVLTATPPALPESEGPKG